MNKIETLTINGFQSHLNTQLNLHSGFNVITGASDCGKTAIIRALKWVLFNNPTGESFINEKLGQASVSVLFSGNLQVIRVRGKNENYYRVYDGGQEEKYQGFGVNVPAEILNITKIPAAYFGEYEVLMSFGLQLDPPFLLSETSGQAARILGKLANTEDADLATKDVNSDLFRSRQEKNTLELSLEKIKKEIESYGYLENAINRLGILQLMVTELNQIKDKQTRLMDLYKAHKSVLLQIINQMAVLHKTKNIENAEKIIALLEHKLNQKNKLQAVNCSYSMIQKSIEKINNSIEKFALIPLVEQLQVMIESMFINQNNLKKLFDTFESVLTRISIFQNEYEKQSNQETSYKKDFSEFLKDLKICPICLSEIGETQINNIVG